MSQKTMGILARMFRWLWARFGDWNRLVALLDLLDWKTGLFSVISGLLMVFFGATNMDWSPQTIMAVAIVVAAAVAVLVVAIRLLLLLPASSTMATLSVDGPDLFRDANYKNKNQWRMKVHNAGPAVAQNVKVTLTAGSPGPNSARWTGDYPYPVYPVGTIKHDAGQISTAAIARHINPNDDELYEIMCGWEAETGNPRCYTDINTRGGGHNDIHIEPGERWKLSYQVTAGNALPIGFFLEIFVENAQVKVAKAS